MHGEVTDPIGDVVAVPGVASPPDLIRGTVDVGGDNATFAIQFAPGTFDPQTTRVTIQLDTDSDMSTGIRTVQGLGIDYIVDLWAQIDQAKIEQAVPSGGCTESSPCYAMVGTAARTIVADGMRVTVPLAMFGRTDGHVAFRVIAYVSPQPSGPPTIVSDLMPDATLSPGAVH